jgi:hypothetical protein
MTTIDTDVNNYTNTELMEIIGAENYDLKEVNEKANKLIKQFKSSNPELANFFSEIKLVLKQYISELDDEEPYTDKQTNEWYKNESLTQSDENQDKKITKRKNKIDVYGNNHVPMKQETLGVSNTFNVPVAQDSLNPNLKNTFNRFVNIDSQFRQSAGLDNPSTDYTLDLSDPLTNALSLRLFCYQIPFTWYVIDAAYGNSFFWITYDATTSIPIVMPDGNYSPSEFVTTLNSVFSKAGFTFSGTSPVNTPVSYNSNNGKLTLNLFGGVFAGGTILNVTYPSFAITESTIITFYDYSAYLRNSLVPACSNNNYINQTLGWIMGYRTPFEAVKSTGNTAIAILDLNGTKYLILVIDDFNQNHVNNGLVSITEFSNNLKMPSYWSPDLPYICIEPDGVADNINELENDNTGLNIASKLEVDYKPRQIILPSAPRTLTQPQIYTINEIMKNRNNNTNYRTRAPTNPDILAIMPVKTTNLNIGTMISEMSGSLQENIRQYFGPVNIERMKIKLIDDKGNLVNLNGIDWSFTLICECLYQY